MIDDDDDEEEEEDDDDDDVDDDDDDAAAADDDDDVLREFAAPLMHDILIVTMTLGPISVIFHLVVISYH